MIRQHDVDKNFYKAIGVWIGGLLLLGVTDYLLRLISGSYHALGMNETLWFLLQVFLGVASLAYLVRAVRQMASYRALMLSGITIAAGLLAYFILIWIYILGTGVDSV